MRRGALQHVIFLFLWLQLQPATCDRLERNRQLAEDEDGNGGGQILPPPMCTSLPEFDSRQTETVTSFYAMADVPYSTEERYCLNEQLRGISLSSSSQGPSFMVHMGDIKSGKKKYPCDYAAYNDIARIWTHPENSRGYDPRDVFWTIGDNEWQDCEDPDEGWDLWNQHFGAGNPYGFGTLSSSRNVERQTYEELKPGVDRSENFAFYKKNVLFVGLNMLKSLDDIDVRDYYRHNYEWCRDKLDKYSRRGMEAAVFFGHVYLKDEDYIGDYFTNDFFDLLRDVYPDLPVLYVHGDWHDFCIRNPHPYKNNLWALELDDGKTAPPVLVSILRNRNSGKHYFDVDRRGGNYPNDSCTQIKEDTWKDASPDDSSSPNDNSGLPKLTLVDQNPSSDDLPLGTCFGDCDRDSDCAYELECYERDGKSSIPGCNGSGLTDRDYCFAPPGDLYIVGNNGEPTESFPLLSCQGDCDRDEDCSGSLKCFNRPDRTSVPGCRGTGSSGRDYCSHENSGKKRLVLRGDNGSPSSAFPLGKCQGDCDSDEDCRGFLECFMREEFELVPGCQDGGERGKDYCYKKPKLTIVGDNGDPGSVFPLGKCQGDCDFDDECAGELRCNSRDGFEPVEGCRGQGLAGKDYCI